MPVTRRALAALAVATLALPTAYAASPLLDAMVAFDAVYIPALVQTSAAPSTDAAAPARAQAALRRLRDRWPALRVALEIRKPADWSAALEFVGRQLEVAHAAAALSDWPAAHRALEPVRMTLMKAREGAGIDYFVDRLTRFHEPMETLLELARGSPSPMPPAMRDEFERAFAEARASWRLVELNLPEAAAYRMGARRVVLFKEGLAEVSKALSALSDTLRTDDAAALPKVAPALRPAFSRVFASFGAAPDEIIDP